MKHLKLYEDFQTESVLDEGIMDFIKNYTKKITDKKIADKVDIAMTEYKKYSNAWKVKSLTQEELVAQLEIAKEDKFAGKWALNTKENKIYWLTSDKIKWGSAGA